MKSSITPVIWEIPERKVTEQICAGSHNTNLLNPDGPEKTSEILPQTGPNSDKAV